MTFKIYINNTAAVVYDNIAPNRDVVHLSRYFSRSAIEAITGAATFSISIRCDMASGSGTVYYSQLITHVFRR